MNLDPDLSVDADLIDPGLSNVFDPPDAPDIILMAPARSSSSVVHEHGTAVPVGTIVPVQNGTTSPSSSNGTVQRAVFRVVRCVEITSCVSQLSSYFPTLFTDA